MRSYILNTIIHIVIFALVPLASFADTDMDAKFQSVCVKTWMEKAGSTSDKVAYQNFGEKYCGCAAGKDLSTKESLRKAAQICMSQVILRDTMDSLEDEGLNNIKQEKIESSCQDKWKMVYPDMNDNMATRTADYCQCAAPKLMDVIADKDNLTDKEWYQRIDSIGTECADKVEADRDTSNIKSNE